MITAVENFVQNRFNCYIRMISGEFVHSVNIMISILLGAVCYYIYYIFQMDKSSQYLNNIFNNSFFICDCLLLIPIFCRSFDNSSIALFNFLFSIFLSIQNVKIIILLQAFAQFLILLLLAILPFQSSIVLLQLDLAM